MSDYYPLIELAKPFMDSDRLPLAHKRAKDTLTRLMSDRRCFTMAEFDDEGKMIGAIAVSTGHNTYADKQHAQVIFWFGSPLLLDEGLAWAMNRPAIRMMMVFFDRTVRDGVYSLLQRKGFEKTGDMYVYWRV